MRIALHIIRTLIIASLATLAAAQEVSIPDPGLNAAVREALQKPNGPLTEEDLLSLTALDAHRRNVRSIGGLEAAHNLTSLNLQFNHLVDFSLPDTFTKLTFLDLSFNSIVNCSISTGPTNLITLILANNRLSELILPESLSGLVNLNLEDNELTSFNLSSNQTSLAFLDLGFNSLTNLALPNGLTNLSAIILAGNLLTNYALPHGLTGLTELDLHINQLTDFSVPAELSGLTNLNLNENQLTSFALPAGLTNLAVLDLSFNQLTNLNLPVDAKSLTDLDLDFNEFTHLDLPAGLNHLGRLQLRANQFTNFVLRADLSALTYFDIGENQLGSITLPPGLSHLTALRISGNTNLTSLMLPSGLTNLTGIFLRYNQLTNLVLPPDLFHLTSIDVLGNQLSHLVLPEGLTNLNELALSGNLLTNLTLPPDMTRLTWLVLNGNPLATLVLPDPLAASTNLTQTLADLRSDGVSVFTYPLTIELIRVQQRVGAFQFAIAGPPGVYSVFGSADFRTWNEVGVTTNRLGKIVFTDTLSHQSALKFYRALLQGPPTNTVADTLVFIPPNTFTMGSPTNELGHSADEGPETLVTFSHGFWIAKYLVTQGDYLAVTGTNPSGFPGDLSRPVESVSWFAASNYCAQLTQQDLSAGRIPPSTHYRLPTEAEWECAARAGTSTRFYFGDDEADLASHAWYGVNSGLTPHPVGLKEPNAWGLYDMEGNVWEWCQDWYGAYSGGSVTDPQGPASNAIGFKVIRGGAWEASEFDCRSASRWFEPASPFISDFIIGFRVVLVTDP